MDKLSFVSRHEPTEQQLRAAASLGFDLVQLNESFPSDPRKAVDWLWRRSTNGFISGVFKVPVINEATAKGLKVLYYERMRDRENPDSFHDDPKFRQGWILSREGSVLVPIPEEE